LGALDPLLHAVGLELTSRLGADGFDLSGMIAGVISRLRVEIERIDHAIRKLVAVQQAIASDASSAICAR
jgi:hypothetical protein